MGSNAQQQPANWGGMTQDQQAAYVGQKLTNPMSKAPPPPPDYTGAAEKQAQSGQQSVNQQTQANRPDQSTSFGSTQWTKNADGSWTQNTSLNPAMQGLQNNFTQQLSGASGDGARQAAFNAALGQQTSRLDPTWNQQQAQLDQRLANQGLDPASQAAQAAQGNFSRARNDAYQGAYNNAVGLGQQAQAQNFSQGMQGLNGLNGFMTMPSFMGAGAYQPTQYLPATVAQGTYGLTANAQANQQTADWISGGSQLAGAGVMASDERVKHEVQRLPLEAVPGVPLATFRFNDSPGHKWVGVIAQDVEKVRPEAVLEAPGGMKLVNYGLLGLTPFVVEE